MKRAILFLLCAAPLPAHIMSMSTGDIVVEGNRARYEMRMPLYEMPHVKDAGKTLFENIRFGTSGQAARLVKRSCREDAGQGAYFCSAEYEFPEAVDRLEVECTFHSVTVPNHVHLLRAERGGRRDQAIFDFSFPKATIRFEPPSAAEIAFTQSAAGWWRAVSGPAQVLFLASLVLAARGRRELLLLAGMFLVGQVVAAVAAPLAGWRPPARFVEAAAALTIAYLAVEILVLPKAGQRWLIAGVLGGFHGLYLELFLRSTEYQAGYVLAGAAVAEAMLIALFAFAFSRIGRVAAALKPVQVSASLLFVVGMVWFVLRLGG
ncbi:MAG: HupE/UreJ family protein [Bryobacteraceae bacterium]